MAFVFDKLSAKSKRAAFAKMDRTKAGRKLPAGGKTSSSAGGSGGGTPAAQSSAMAKLQNAKQAIARIDSADQRLASISEQLKNRKISAVEARRQLDEVRGSKPTAAHKMSKKKRSTR